MFSGCKPILQTKLGLGLGVNTEVASAVRAEGGTVGMDRWVKSGKSVLTVDC